MYYGAPAERLISPCSCEHFTIALGWSVVFGSSWLVVYVVALAVGFHLRVVLHEEPWLRRQFPEAWRAYSATVPRWLPRLWADKGDQRD
jgi:protein-S-isoprenylcysteine O-methyltransferase Ste14